MAEAQTVSPDPGVASELTAFQRNILTVLSEEARYGLAIKRELEAYYGDEVNHGRLYPNLDELVADGLIAKSERDKRTNEYELTEAGLEAVLDQLAWTFSKLATDEARTERIQDLLERYE